MVTEYTITQERLLETFTELIRINSPSFEEGEIGSVLAAKLKRAGCKVFVEQYGRSFNIRAFKEGDKRHVPPLLLSAHMDTVEPTHALTFTMENGIIRSTGGTVLGADDKGALSQIIEAITTLDEKNISHGDVEIIFTSAEEEGLFGAKNLDFAKIVSRQALVLDSSGRVGSLVIGAPGCYVYEMRIAGRAAHAGIEPEKGISAIKAAARIIEAAPDGRIDAETTANIGMIEGGTATNVVPREVTIRGEVRSHNSETLARTKKAIFDGARLIAEDSQARLSIVEFEDYKAFVIDRKDPFLAFMEGVFRKCDIEPSLVVTGGGSDANVFNQHGITAINMSIGMQKVHSADEHISIRDLCDGCRVVLHAIIDFKELSADGS